MRKMYELTDKQRERLLEASKHVPLVALNAGMPASAQERANRVWREIGDELGFQYLTVRPAHRKSDRFFTAEET